MAFRTKPRTNLEILRGIELVKANAGPDMKSIHLISCDLAQVALSPSGFGCTKQPDGSIVTVLNNKLIDVVAIT